MSEPDELTSRERAFVDFYVKTGGHNVTQCAIAAGYSTRGAAVAGHRLINRKRVIDALRIECDRAFRASGSVL